MRTRISYSCDPRAGGWILDTRVPYPSRQLRPETVRFCTVLERTAWQALVWVTEKARTAARSAPYQSRMCRALLDSTGTANALSAYGCGEVVFAQGDTCTRVRYIQIGYVKLSV